MKKDQYIPHEVSMRTSRKTKCATFSKRNVKKYTF